MLHGGGSLGRLFKDVLVHGALAGILAGLIFFEFGGGSALLWAQHEPLTSLAAFLFVCAEVGVAAAVLIALACDE